MTTSQTQKQTTIVTETWLNDLDRDKIWLNACELSKNRSVHAINKTERRGGGLALIHDNMFKVKLIAHGSNRSFEYATWSVTYGSIFTLTAIYHPPPSDRNQATNSNFTDNFIDNLTDLIANHENNIILGDFNLHVNDGSDAEASVFQDTTEALGLIRHVNSPTHKDNNTLDLIMTEIHSKVRVKEIVPDHLSLTTELLQPS